MAQNAINDNPTAELEAAFTKDPLMAAEAVGLHYVNDSGPGIRRERVGDDFNYIRPDGKPVRKPADLARIKALGIPPAYTEVWICPSSQGHLQATGRDARGRKQYRYHSRWRAVRDESKYGRMLAFGQALPTIRGQVDKDLARPGLSRPKVLAVVVRLLEATLIRVGNAEYAKTNKSFGLTTMRDRHVAIEGASIRFKFRGKSGKDHNITLNDRRLANIVKRCRDLPGYELFQYLDENGQHQTIGSNEVNQYLREISGQDFTAKDFRTWAGTVQAALVLQAFESSEKITQLKKNITLAIEQVSQKLGNTPTICRKCYVHPAVVEAYLDGSLSEILAYPLQQAPEQPEQPCLNSDEAAVLAFLQKRLSEPSSELIASI